MQYDWSSIIAPEESIEKEFSLSPLFLQSILAVTLLFAILTVVVSFLAGAAVLLLGIFYWYYLKRAKHYAFTKKRVILVDAFLGTNITTIDYSQITDVTVEQSVIDEVGKWGTLVINTAGTHAPAFRLSFIGDPKGMKQQLDSVRDSNAPVV